MYQIKTGSYPITAWECSYMSDWQTGDLAVALEDYLPTLPIDPINETESSSPNGFYNYCFHSKDYGGSGQWYMLVYALEKPDINREPIAGVTACDGTVFNYRAGSLGYRITAGRGCL